MMNSATSCTHRRLHIPTLPKAMSASVCTKLCTGGSSNIKVTKPPPQAALSSKREEHHSVTNLCRACFPQLSLSKHHLSEPLELPLLHALYPLVQTLSQNKLQPTFSKIYISIQMTQDKNIYAKKPRPATPPKTQFILPQHWVC